MDEFTRQVGKDLRALLKEANASVENMLDELSREGEAGKKSLLEEGRYVIKDPDLFRDLYRSFDELSKFRREPSTLKMVGNAVASAYRTLKWIVW